MAEEPAQLVAACAAAVPNGDDLRIALLPDRFRQVADLPDLIRLRHQLISARHGA